MTEFLVETLPSEVLVYDQVHHRAHCLSPVAARVWKLCESGSLEEAREATRGSDQSLEAVLSQLEAAGLVRARERVNRSRRGMLGKTAVAAGIVLASPIIYSIVSPSVAEAASVCGTNGKPCCTSNPRCKTGVCITGTCRG